MKAIVFERFGDPEEVLQLRDMPVPEVGAGQVRVRMRASPLNPSDLLVVRGEYGRLPTLPATPGFEGVGLIDAVGPGLLHYIRRLRPGRRVAVPNNRGGNWQEYVVIPARNAVPVPAALTDEQAATFFVNPASAIMTRRVLKVPANAWLVQTAAGSALGRMVIRLGQQDGFRTINVVRRRDQAEELGRAGVATICTADESIEERVRALTNGQGASFALDAVGGSSGSAVARALAPEGRMLIYGSLSGEPLTLDPRQLLVGGHSVQGFWLANWMARQGTFTLLGLFRQIGALMQQGVLTTEVAAAYSLDDIRTAVQAATQPGRTGKVMLRMER